jgi:hypothetical protein
MTEFQVIYFLFGAGFIYFIGFAYDIAKLRNRCKKLEEKVFGPFYSGD